MLASAPERIAATAGRVPAYTAGSQKWNGKRPSLVPNATKNVTAIRIAAFGSTSLIRVAIPAISSVPVT